MVIGVGYCLFRALAQALAGGEQNYSTIQLLLQRFENLNKQVFKELLTELKQAKHNYMLTYGTARYMGNSD